MPAVVLACPSCGFDNPKAWRACAKCGASLAIAAGRTGAQSFRDATIVTAGPDFGEDMSTIVDPEGPGADGETDELSRTAPDKRVLADDVHKPLKDGKPVKIKTRIFIAYPGAFALARS